MDNVVLGNRDNLVLASPLAITILDYCDSLFHFDSFRLEPLNNN